jgi:hypothetical protein
MQINWSLSLNAFFWLNILLFSVYEIVRLLNILKMRRQNENNDG